MFSIDFQNVCNRVCRVVPILLMAFVLTGLSNAVRAQAQQEPTPAGSDPQKQEAPPAAGGPQTDVGPYAIPKKKEEPPAPPPERPKKIEGMPDYSIRVDVPLVNLDVMVTTKDGQFIPGLKQDNFRVFEDGAPQTISNFNTSEAPITAVMLIEFASPTIRSCMTPCKPATPLPTASKRTIGLQSFLMT